MDILIKLAKNPVKITSLSIVASLLFSVSLPLTAAALTSAATTNENETVTSSEVKSALTNTSGVLAASDQTKTTSDSDSALKAATAGTTIDVPKDASDGVTLDSTNGPAIGIELPNADDATAAKQIAPGTVAYTGDNGSANAVQVTEDGGVRMLTVIDNPDAPTEYDYKVTVPGGGHIALTEDGGATVFSEANVAIASVAAPWAKDANNKPIRTFFTTDGQTLTQHIEHNVPGVVYPVTADPIWFAVSAAIFWWAVQRCGAGGMISAVFEYVGGSRSKRAIAAAGAAGCIASFVGGWGILKNVVRIVRW